MTLQRRRRRRSRLRPLVPATTRCAVKGRCRCRRRSVGVVEPPSSDAASSTHRTAAAAAAAAAAPADASGSRSQSASHGGVEYGRVFRRSELCAQRLHQQGQRRSGALRKSRLLRCFFFVSVLGSRTKTCLALAGSIHVTVATHHVPQSNVPLARRYVHRTDGCLFVVARPATAPSPTTTTTTTTTTAAATAASRGRDGKTPAVHQQQSDPKRFFVAAISQW